MKSIFCQNSLGSIIVILFTSFLQISCNDSPRKLPKDTGKIENKDTLHQKPPASFSDTIIIDFSSAVFYFPDSLQLKKIRSTTDPKIFESLTHENFYQVRNSKLVLKQYYPYVKITDISDTRYLLFKLKRTNTVIIDLNKTNDPYGLFIFDTKKPPQQVDMTNIETELGFYFRKD